jgi:hypothetical protein
MYVGQLSAPKWAFNVSKIYVFLNKISVRKILGTRKEIVRVLTVYSI